MPLLQAPLPEANTANPPNKANTANLPSNNNKGSTAPLPGLLLDSNTANNPLSIALLPGRLLRLRVDRWM